MYFESKEDAMEWMDAEVDDPYIDNHRFAFKDDDAGMSEYDEKAHNGCCGYFDAEVNVGGRFAMIGCNYGH